MIKVFMLREYSMKSMNDYEQELETLLNEGWKVIRVDKANEGLIYILEK